MKVPMIPQMMPFLADSSGYGPDNGIVMQVPGGTVWTGWTVFESGRERFNLAGSDGGYAYGCYQFDIGYSLVDFFENFAYPIIRHTMERSSTS